MAWFHVNLVNSNVKWIEMNYDHFHTKLNLVKRATLSDYESDWDDLEKQNSRLVWWSVIFSTSRCNLAKIESCNKILQNIESCNKIFCAELNQPEYSNKVLCDALTCSCVQSVEKLQYMRCAPKLCIRGSKNCPENAENINIWYFLQSELICWTDTFEFLIRFLWMQEILQTCARL